MKKLRKIGSANRITKITFCQCEFCKKSFTIVNNEIFYFCPKCGADFLYEEGEI
jgi:predicted RNA-binding Zn-ribbon protein involved in translation (DUF1610 family)